MRRPILRHVSCSLALVALAALTCASCASGRGQSDADDPVAAKEAQRAKLARKINACAIRRAMHERATKDIYRFREVYKAAELALSDSPPAYLSRNHHWRADWNPESIEGLEMTWDADGLRLVGQARSWSDLAEFLHRVNRDKQLDLGVAETSPTGDGKIAFRLEPTEALSQPLHGVQFGPALFPPKKGRSLEEYASDLCDIGGSELPTGARIPDSHAPEELGSARHGDWMRTTLRVHGASDSSAWLVGRVQGFHGVSARFGGGDVVLDFYQLELAEDFDAAKWLSDEARLPDPKQDTLGEPPEGTELITWQEENNFPTGVSRSLLSNISWYRYESIHRLYHSLADQYERLALADALRERNARALRAALCLTRGYTAPLEEEDASIKTRPLHVAKLVFEVPADGTMGGLNVDHFRLRGDGHTEWKYSAPNSATLDSVERTFRACMGAAEVDAARAKAAKGHRWEGQAIATASGLFTAQSDAIELPRFDDGREFVLAVRANRYTLRNELYTVQNRISRSHQQLDTLSRIAPPEARLGDLVGELTEASAAFGVDIAKLSQQPFQGDGWRQVRPHVVEIEASASPANLVAFATQLFDLDRQLVPGDLVIEPQSEGNRLVLRGTFYAFGGS